MDKETFYRGEKLDRVNSISDLCGGEPRDVSYGHSWSGVIRPVDGGYRVPGTGTTSEVWPIPIFGSGQGEENCWNLPIKQRIGAGEDGGD